MRFDPYVHHRRSFRLPDHDYRAAGAYFVTICSWQRDCIFYDPSLVAMIERKWRSIVNHGHPMAYGEFVVMPNHVHGIVWIVQEQPFVGARHDDSRTLVNRRYGIPATDGAGKSAGASPLRPALPYAPRGAPPGSLGAIVGTFKSVTARRINTIRHTPGLPVWQRDYHEHVIRNEAGLRRIRRYIAANPANWENDPDNLPHVPLAPFTV